MSSGLLHVAGESTDTSLALLPRASSGDRRAMSLLLERMRPFLCRIGHGRLPLWARARVETDDLVQESLVRALRHIPRFEGQSMQDFRNWLRAVFRNLVIDETRYVGRVGVGRELAESVDDGARSPEEALAEHERADVFAVALRRLTPGERRLVTCRLQDGCSFQELAQRLGKPTADAARMSYNRALKKFRDEARSLIADPQGRTATV